MPAPGRPSRAVRRREALARAVVQTLAQARLEAGVSRAQLATRCDVSVHTLAKIEQLSVTDPGFTLVATIAEALDLPLDQLLSKARDTLGNTKRDESDLI